MKSFIVIFSPVAIDEVEQTIDYYEERQSGLGKRFAAQLQLTLMQSNVTLSLPPFGTIISVALV